jgi:hypothetical protein
MYTHKVGVCLIEGFQRPLPSNVRCEEGKVNSYYSLQTL